MGDRVVFECGCGQELDARTQRRGEIILCPACESRVMIPDNDDVQTGHQEHPQDRLPLTDDIKRKSVAWCMILASMLFAGWLMGAFSGDPHLRQARYRSGSPPPSPSSYQERLRQQLNIRSIGEWENNHVVMFDLKQNLTTAMTKAALQRDVRDILKEYSGAGIPIASVEVVAFAPLTDVYGKTESQKVLTARYTKRTLEKIHWSEFNFQNVYRVADEVTLHPAVTP